MFHIVSFLSGQCQLISSSQQVIEDQLYSGQTVAVSAALASLTSLFIGFTLGYSVATCRRSAVGDVTNDVMPHRSQWTTATTSVRDKLVERSMTKSQLIAVLSGRGGVAAETVAATSRSRLTVDPPLMQNYETASTTRLSARYTEQ